MFPSLRLEPVQLDGRDRADVQASDVRRLDEVAGSTPLSFVIALHTAFRDFFNHLGLRDIPRRSRRETCIRSGAILRSGESAWIHPGPQVRQASFSNQPRSRTSRSHSGHAVFLHLVGMDA